MTYYLYNVHIIILGNIYAEYTLGNYLYFLYYIIVILYIMKKRFKSFDKIAEEFLINEKFQRISNESHHGITRMEHSMRVARNVYKISKKLNLDYISATRAAIVHDFFTNEEFGVNRGLIQGVVHPDIALANAKGEFKINEKEANAIEAHMFPLSTVLPKSKEAWCLTLVDKGVAIYEYGANKWNIKRLVSPVGYACALAFIYIMNFLTINNR